MVAPHNGIRRGVRRLDGKEKRAEGIGGPVEEAGRQSMMLRCSEPLPVTLGRDGQMWSRRLLEFLKQPKLMDSTGPTASASIADPLGPVNLWNQVPPRFALSTEHPSVAGFLPLVKDEIQELMDILDRPKFFEFIASHNSPWGHCRLTLALSRGGATQTLK